MGGVLSPGEVLAEVTGGVRRGSLPVPQFKVGDHVTGRGDMVGVVVGLNSVIAGADDDDVMVRWEDGEEWRYPPTFLTLCSQDTDIPDREIPPCLNSFEAAFGAIPDFPIPEPETEAIGPGLKYDEGKDPWELLPIEEVEDIVKVLAHGAKKYGPNNWQNVEPADRYYAAALRHLVAWKKGQKNDDGPGGSGLPHLAHAACSLLFLAWKDRNQ